MSDGLIKAKVLDPEGKEVGHRESRVEDDKVIVVNLDTFSHLCFFKQN